jgi:hypothetical protein
VVDADLMDVTYNVKEADYALKHLDAWTAPEREHTPLYWIFRGKVGKVAQGYQPMAQPRRHALSPVEKRFVSHIATSTELISFRCTA